MINSDKRVLEHFYNLLDQTKDKEKVVVNRQNIQYLVNKLAKHFALEHANAKNKERLKDRALKIKRQTKEINRLHEDLKYWKSNSMDKRHKIGELMQENQNLKKRHR